MCVERVEKLYMMGSVICGERVGFGRDIII